MERSEQTGVSYTVPFPPSANRAYRNVLGRTLISREGRAYREVVRALLGPAGAPRFTGRIALRMDAFPPDRRRRDLDNLCKLTLDSVQHAGVYEDDSQIDLLIVRRGPVVHGGLVRVCIEQSPPTLCPLCGGVYPTAVETNREPPAALGVPHPVRAMLRK